MSFEPSLVLIFLCCAFSAVELSSHKSYRIFCVILVALFVYVIAGRDIYTVPDTPVYVENYILTDANAELSSIFDGTYGAGWNLFNLLCRKAGLDYRVFLGLIALIPCLLYFYAANLLDKNAY